MTYHVSLDGRILLIQFSGTLTREDLESFGKELLALEQHGTNTPNRLTDFRQITTAAVGYAEIAPLAELSRTRPLAHDIRSAMLVQEPVQMGLARMFQILNEHPRVTMRIFEDEASARAWLATESLHDREDAP